MGKERCLLDRSEPQHPEKAAALAFFQGPQDKASRFRDTGAGSKHPPGTRGAAPATLTRTGTNVHTPTYSYFIMPIPPRYFFSFFFTSFFCFFFFFFLSSTSAAAAGKEGRSG